MRSWQTLAGESGAETRCSRMQEVEGLGMQASHASSSWGGRRDRKGGRVGL
jgi:hypothetical protein